MVAWLTGCNLKYKLCYINVTVPPAKSNLGEACGKIKRSNRKHYRANWRESDTASGRKH